MNEENLLPGEILKKLDDAIDRLEHLDEFLENHSTGKDRPKHLYGVAREMWSHFGEEVQQQIALLKAKREEHLRDDAHRPPRLVCPHCEYDGELGPGITKHDGFRILQPILEPRHVRAYDRDEAQMLIGDPCERFDSFDMISEPGYVECIDGKPEPADNPLEVEFRNMLRGRWLLLCGRCFKYFDARLFIERCHLHYGVYPQKNKENGGAQ